MAEIITPNVIAPNAIDLALSPPMVVLGKIVDAYSLQGAVKIFPFADDPAAWAKLPSWWLGSEAEAEAHANANTGAWVKTALKSCRLQNTFLIAEFVGFVDRNAAEALCGKFIGVPKSALPPPQKGEFYWADLIGLRVVNTEGACLGEVLGLIETPANTVLRVGVLVNAADAVNEKTRDKATHRSHPSAEQLLPFVGAVILDVDLAAKVVRVDWGADW